MAKGPKPDYDNIGPLVVDVEEQGDTAVVTFKCPVTGVEVEGQAEFPKDGIGTKAGRIARAGAMDRVRIGVVRQVQKSAGTLGTLGLGLGEQAARKRTAGRSETKPRHSEKATHGAVVAAFESVADQFRWEDANDRWLSVTAPGFEPSPFDAHLEAHPVTSPHDRQMLARILATIVGAEGGTSDEEREMFAALAPGTDLDGLIAQWAPAATDLQATQPGATRESMLLLAWALAVTDEQLSSKETELLDWYAAALGVAPSRAAELRAIVERDVLDA